MENVTQFKKDLAALSDENLNHNWKVYLIRKGKGTKAEREEAIEVLELIEKERKKRKKNGKK